MKFLAVAFLACALDCTAATNAVIESDEMHITVFSVFHMTVRESVQIRILNKEGYDFAVFKDYYNSFKKLHSISYRIVDASGKVLKRLGRGDVQDIPLSSSSDISDARLVALDPGYQAYPFTAQIDTEFDYDGFISFPEWRPRGTSDLEVKSSTLILDLPTGFLFRHKEMNGVAAPEESTNAAGPTYTWSVKDLPALPDPISEKIFEMQEPTVFLAPMNFELNGVNGSLKSWQDFGEWFLTLNANRSTLNARTKETLDRIKADDATTEGKVEEIYKYLQGRTRYISIQLGIGGYQAIPAIQVDENGYGDCKALANFMKAMLDYSGIPSNFVMARAGDDEPDVMEDFPSGQFNHVFLAVPLTKDTMLLECTSQLVPPNYIGTFTDDRNVLWVAPGASKVLRTPAYKATGNMRLDTAMVTFNEKGDAEILLHMKLTGAYFSEMLAYKSLQADEVERINNEKFDLKDYTIKSFQYNVPDPTTPHLDLLFDLQSVGLGQSLAGRMLIPVDLLACNDEDVLVDPLSKVGEVSRPFTVEDHVQVKFPDKFRMDNLPAERTLDSPYGSMDIKFSRLDENNILIERKLTFKKGLYLNDDFDRFYDYVRQVRAAGKNKLILQSKT